MYAHIYTYTYVYIKTLKIVQEKKIKIKSQIRSRTNDVLGNVNLLASRFNVNGRIYERRRKQRRVCRTGRLAV